MTDRYIDWLPACLPAWLIDWLIDLGGLIIHSQITTLSRPYDILRILAILISREVYTIT